MKGKMVFTGSVLISLLSSGMVAFASNNGSNTLSLTRQPAPVVVQSDSAHLLTPQPASPTKKKVKKQQKRKKQKVAHKRHVKAHSVKRKHKKASVKHRHIIQPAVKATPVATPVVFLTRKPVATTTSTPIHVASIPDEDNTPPVSHVERKELPDSGSSNSRFLHPYVGVSAGLFRSKMAAGNMTTTVGLVSYTYDASSTNKALPVYGFSLGDELRFEHNIDWQLGFSYLKQSTTRLSGNLTQTTDDVPGSNIYRYHYTVATQQWFIDSKLLFQMNGYMHPYAYMGVGESNNKAYQFSTTVPSPLSLTLSFPSRSARALAYSLGFGMDLNLMKNLRLGVGYRYTYLGTISTNNGVYSAFGLNTATPVKLKQTGVTMNTVLAQLIYVY